MDKKKIAIYGGLGIAVLGGLYLVVRHGHSNTQQANADASPAGSLVYGGATQSTGGGSGTGSNSTFTPPNVGQLSTTSDLGSILTALLPILQPTNSPANPKAPETITPVPSGLSLANAQSLVTSAYNTFLGRNPENGPGPTTWIQGLVSGKLSVNQVEAGIQNSPEAVIDNLYHTLLGRNADPAGLTGWEDLLNKGTSINSIQQMIMGSAEYQNLHPGAQTGGGPVQTTSTASTATRGVSTNSASISYTAPSTNSQTSNNNIDIGFTPVGNVTVDQTRQTIRPTVGFGTRTTQTNAA